MEAKEQIQEIYRLLEGNKRFKYISGWAVILAGVLCTSAALVAANIIHISPVDVLPKSLTTLSHFGKALIFSDLFKLVLVFTSLIVITAALAGFIIWKAMTPEQRSSSKSSIKVMSLIYLLYLTLGFLLVYYLFDHSFNYDLTVLCIPLMLLLYGLSHIHAANHSLSELKYFGAFLFISGVFGIILPAWSLAIWTFAMGAGHLIMGIYLLTKNKN